MMQKTDEAKKALRIFFSSFSEFQGFDGWVIGKLCFERREAGGFSGALSCRKKKRYAVLEAARGDICMKMHLIKGFLEKAGDVGRKEASDGRAEGDALAEKDADCIFLGEKVFHAEEISDFVRETGDRNSIHQAERPVVPGLLITEWIWEKGCLPVLSGAGGSPAFTDRKDFPVILRFRFALHVGECMKVYGDPLSRKIFAVKNDRGCRTLLWELYEEKESR